MLHRDVMCHVQERLRQRMNYQFQRPGSFTIWPSFDPCDGEQQCIIYSIALIQNIYDMTCTVCCTRVE